MSSDVMDPDPVKKNAVTNTDEQEVAVNHSTTDRGYDEPASASTPNANATNNEKQTAEEVKAESEKKGKPSQLNKNF